MAKYTKSQLKRTLIITVVLCLVVAILAATVIISAYRTSNKLFKDQSFVKTLAEVFDITPREVDQEFLDQFEYFRYSFHVYDNNGINLYPYVILGTKDYADSLFNNAEEGSEHEHNHDESSEAETSGDVSSNTSEEVSGQVYNKDYFIVPAYFTSAEDL